MKKLLFFMLSIVFAMGASAEKQPMDFSQMTNGWGSSFELSTKTITITFTDTWKGHGWWLGSYDAEKYTHFVVELSEAATIDINVVVVYTEKEGDNNKNTTVSVAKGSTQGTVALDETLKHGIQQIYIGNTGETGSVTLQDAYFYREGPSFGTIDYDITLSGDNQVDIRKEDLTDYPDNAIVTVVLNHAANINGWGIAGFNTFEDNTTVYNFNAKSDGTSSSYEFTIAQLIAFAGEHDGFYFNHWEQGQEGKKVDSSIESFKVTLGTIIPISQAGIGSMMLPFDAAIPQGMRVYAVGTCENGVLNLNSVESIVANSPYIIKGEAKNYNFVGEAEVENFQYKDNAGNFRGTYEQITAPVGSYVLQDGDQGAGFYRVEEGKQPTVNAHRAYLTGLPTGGNSCLRLAFDDEVVTGIDAVETETTLSGAFYNLAGQRTNGVKTGIIIADGKKRFIK